MFRRKSLNYGLIIALQIGLSATSLQAATFVVNNLGDTNDCNATTCTLRGAMNAAKAATGVHTINFSVSGTIIANGLPILFSGLTIDGSGQNVTITMNGALVLEAGNLVLRKVTLANCQSSPILVDAQASLQVEDSTFAGNSMELSGAAIVNLGAVSIQNSTFTRNSATAAGAILNHGTLTIVGSTFSGNSSITYAGAIKSDGTLTISGSTFSGNSAPMAAGAIQNYGPASILNSTFTGNSTTVAPPDITIGHGGAVENFGAMEISYSTFAGNSGSETIRSLGGGVLTLKNTLVANPAGGVNCGDITDRGGNLSYPDNTCPGINLDPKLAALTNNGGPTQTMALLPGSAAIDAATDCNDAGGNPVLADQRGGARPQGARCDIGAYELSQLVFTGFYPPVANLPAVNNGPAGQSVPVTFSVGGNLGLGILAPGYPASASIDCKTGVATGPLTASSTPGNSVLTYDSFTRLYTVVWQTDKSWAGTCRQMVLRLNDGTDHPARFSFR